jgi:hypothetical protein
MKSVEAAVSIGLLTVCKWSGPRKEDTNIEHPAWPQVEAAIRALNGTTHNDVYLQPAGGEPDSYLCIGGGKGRYIVTGATKGGEFPTLTDPARAGEPEETIVVGGQPGNYPGHWVVDLETALGAARSYFDTGTLGAQITEVS